MNKPLVLIGYGGHGKVLLDALLIRGATVSGIADPALAPGERPEGIAVLPSDEAVLSLSPDAVQLVNGIGSVRSCAAREAIYRRFTACGFHFATVIHPSAVISPRATLGEGCQVMAGAIIQTGTMIGQNSIINTRASVDHDCAIARTVHIAPGAVLCGNVRIGQGSHIGSGAIIIQGITIEPETLVPAGSVITRSPGQEKVDRDSAEKSRTG